MNGNVPKKHQKEVDFQGRARTLKTELTTISEVLTAKFESRIAALETMQEQRASGYTKLLEGHAASTREEQNVL